MQPNKNSRQDCAGKAYCLSVYRFLERNISLSIFSHSRDEKAGRHISPSAKTHSHRELVAGTHKYFLCQFWKSWVESVVFPPAVQQNLHTGLNECREECSSEAVPLWSSRNSQGGVVISGVGASLAALTSVVNKNEWWIIILSNMSYNPVLILLTENFSSAKNKTITK